MRAAYKSDLAKSFANILASPEFCASLAKFTPLKFKPTSQRQDFRMMCSRNIKISVVLFLVLIPIFAALPHNHNLSKRSNFFDLECKGIFNKTMFFRLDRICEDCYQLFRETSIHRLCKANCFVHETFGDCLKVLLIDDEEISQLQHYLKVINGSPYPFHKPVYH
ncbi:ion transport peptide-like isoform X2 [Drosophila yakuba]|uniref:ion transport peptide-like isoform X2 n=1 Tax=Drosophila yakuba TaxID=7245 RepID=UPI0019307954|nr:ion transport peptide-like isoform X2 [Drosophila yakuba]